MAFPSDDEMDETLSAEAMASNVLSLESIGCYKLGKKLGEGAFAVVRIGTHMITGVNVACKICVKTAIKDEYIRKNLYREAEILSSLRHTNIIQLLETLESDTFYVLVMELCEKDVLTHLCSVGVSTEGQARLYGRQLISAFEYLHQKNIVHRDLKAENMMLDKNNNMKIIDFGLSNDMTGKPSLDTQCGSMAYSAPELLSNKAYGKEVDIWSIGVCLYVILTGHLPFGNMSLTDLHAMMLDGKYELPDMMSDDLKDLFIKFFQVKPQKRITIAELWQHAWICAPPDSLDSPVGAGSAPPGIISEMAETAAGASGGGGAPALQREGLNDRVIIQMVRMGFSNQNDQIATAILDNKCDKVTATYHLLIKKQDLLSLQIAKRKTTMERRNSGSGSGRKKLTPLRSDGTKRSSRGGGGDRAHADARELPPSRRGPTESGGRSRSRSMSRGTSAEGEIIDAPVPPGRRQRRNSTSGVTPARSGVPSREVSSLDGFNRKSSLDVPIGMAGMPRTPSRGSLASLDGESRSRANSLGSRTNSLTRQKSANGMSAMMLTYPGDGLDLESRSYSDTISEQVVILMEMQHRGINAENLAELSGLTQRALRVAPDMSLIQLLRKLGWTGTTFAPFTLDDQAPALLVELQAIEDDNDEAKNGGHFTGLTRSRSGSGRSIKSGQISPSPSWGEDSGGDTGVFSDLSASMTMPRRPSLSGERPALPGISRPRPIESPRGSGRQRTFSGSASPRNGGGLGSIGSPSPPPTLVGDVPRRRDSGKGAALRQRGRDRRMSWASSDDDDLRSSKQMSSEHFDGTTTLPSKLLATNLHAVQVKLKRPSAGLNGGQTGAARQLVRPHTSYQC